MANKKIKNIAIVETDSSKDKEKPEVETSGRSVVWTTRIEERDYWYKARKISCQ